jgi:hypothetical protein
VTLQAAASGRGSDSPLDVRLVATPAYKFVRSRIATQAARREQPGPTLGVLSVWVFFGQESRQRHWNAVGQVLGGQGLGKSQLPLQRCGKTLGEDHDPTLVAFGLMDIEPPLFQVQVLDPEVERLAHSQATGVDQVNYQASGITVGVSDLGQETDHFIASRAMPQPGWTFSAKRVNVSNFSFECLPVEKEQRAKGLVLGRDGDAPQSQAGQVSLDLLFSGGQRLGF